MQVAKSVETLAPLLCAYPSAKITEDTIRVYAVALSELSEAELQAGVLRCMRTCRFFPSIAEIMEASREVVEAVKGSEIRDGDEAWQEVQKAVRYTLTYNEPEFSNQQIKQAVDTIGWRSFTECKIGDINTLRAQFLRIYDSICKRRNNERINANVLQLINPGQLQSITGGGLYGEIPKPKNAC